MAGEQYLKKAEILRNRDFDSESYSHDQWTSLFKDLNAELLNHENIGHRIISFWFDILEERGILRDNDASNYNAVNNLLVLLLNKDLTIDTATYIKELVDDLCPGHSTFLLYTYKNDFDPMALDIFISALGLWGLNDLILHLEDERLSDITLYLEHMPSQLYAADDKDNELVCISSAPVNRLFVILHKLKHTHVDLSESLQINLSYLNVTSIHNMIYIDDLRTVRLMTEQFCSPLIDMNKMDEYITFCKSIDRMPSPDEWRAAFTELTHDKCALLPELRV